MNILFFYKYDHGYSMDFWLHEGFMRAVNNHPEVRAFMYGPRMHEVKENNCLTYYDSSYTMKNLEEIFRPDVMILNTKSRMFDYYSPHTKQSRGCILPKDFKDSKIPKVVLEEDYHYETEDDWYHEMGISLILQRHCSQVKRQDKVKMKWFPFSVDTSTFKPTTEYHTRQRKVCFVGSMTGPYPDRIDACEKLSKQNLIDIYSHREKIGINYVNNLRHYISHLNGASMYDITAAKVFEIMASGSLLFTNNFTGLTDLFGESSYCLWNPDNVVQQAKKIINEDGYSREVAENGVKEILKNHTHEKRTEELLTILKGEL